MFFYCNPRTNHNILQTFFATFIQCSSNMLFVCLFIRFTDTSRLCSQHVHQITKTSYYYNATNNEPNFFPKNNQSIWQNQVKANTIPIYPSYIFISNFWLIRISQKESAFTACVCMEKVFLRICCLLPSIQSSGRQAATIQNVCTYTV